MARSVLSGPCPVKPLHGLAHRAETQFKGLELGQCPSGWIVISDKCYFFSKEKKTRDESDRFCVNHAAKLATVKRNDPTLQDNIRSLHSVYWIGLTRRWDSQTNSLIWLWPDGSYE
ncbi:Hypothetical predicted protein [Pelobates cultripes]|uniref:C-type lectin domain-containing protein n=1 Tax=Pelobates cultripes TaxID=61616 RepID=A0AAD1SCP9_PELCU|nr:Hypothetical predicted protein [Pelobates cultripes]